MNEAAEGDQANHVVFIGLGSNIEPETNMPLAMIELRKQVKILSVSSVWHSPAFGTTGPDFLNAVAKLETHHSAEDLKAHILRPIEAKLGRQRGINKNAPRTIDLDTLIFDDEVCQPHIWEYPHLAIPLAECYPQLRNSLTSQTVSEIAETQKTYRNISRTDLSLRQG